MASTWVIAQLYVRSTVPQGLRRRTVLAAVAAIAAFLTVLALSHIWASSMMSTSSDIFLGLSAVSIPGYWCRALLVPSTIRGVNAEHGALVTGSAWPVVPGIAAGRLMVEATGPIFPMSVGLLATIACTQGFPVTALAAAGVVLNVCAISAINVAGEVRDCARSRPNRNALSITIAAAALCSVVIYAIVIAPQSAHLASNIVSWLTFCATTTAVAVAAVALQAMTFPRARLASARTRRRRDRRPPDGIAGLVVLEMRLIVGDQRRRSLFITPGVVAIVSGVVSIVLNADSSGSTAAVVPCAFLGTMFWKERADDDGMQTLLRQLPHGGRRELCARIIAWLPAAAPVIVALSAQYGLSGTIISMATALQALAVGALFTVTSLHASVVRVYIWVSVVILSATVVENVAGALAAPVFKGTDLAASAGTAALVTVSLAWLLERRSRVDASLHGEHHDPYRLTADTPLPLAGRGEASSR